MKSQLCWVVSIAREELKAPENWDTQGAEWDMIYPVLGPEVNDGIYRN